SGVNGAALARARNWSFCYLLEDRCATNSSRPPALLGSIIPQLALVRGCLFLSLLMLHCASRSAVRSITPPLADSIVKEHRPVCAPRAGAKASSHIARSVEFGVGQTQGSDYPVAS